MTEVSIPSPEITADATMIDEKEKINDTLFSVKPSPEYRLLPEKSAGMLPCIK